MEKVAHFAAESVAQVTAECLVQLAPEQVAHFAAESVAGFLRNTQAPKGVTFSAETQAFFVPGSWLPLVFMMTIFFAKYAVGVILARQLPVAGEIVFIGSVSLGYGLLSGVFLARAIGIWQVAKSAAQPQA